MRLVPLMIVLASPLAAQQAVANADVYVHSGQSKSSQVLDTLFHGDTVSLLGLTKTKGYYHVEKAGTKGWAYSRYLDVIDSTATPVTPAGGPTGSPVSGAVDPEWPRPIANSGIFHRAGFPDCGPSGDGGDTPTNLLKNRTDEPSSYHAVTFDAIATARYPKNEKPERSSWPASDLGVIAPIEGVAVTVTGFIASQRGIIVEDSVNSSGESTNCHAKDDPGVDWHMTIVKDKTDPKSAGIVVETTPRVRANGHPWTPAMLASAIANRDSVRISGWLMYDPEHFTQMTGYDPAKPYANVAKVRATLWEVHPITKIEVFQNGGWKAIP
jgi:uncharacterized protein YraI